MDDDHDYRPVDLSRYRELQEEARRAEGKEWLDRIRRQLDDVARGKTP